MTYIFGHKNPDTDSVCSSIALSYLKNALGEKTEPRVLGNINNETKYVLDYFKIDAPEYLNDVKIRIRDIDFEKEAFIHEDSSIDKTFKLMQDLNITAIPLINKDNILNDYVTLKEIAKYLISGSKNHIETTFNNVVETLQGEEVLKYDELINGEITVVGMQSKAFSENVKLTEKDILIVGDRYRILEYAIDSKVKLIILPLNSKIDDELLEKAKNNKINIIKTPLSSYLVSNKMLLSNYAKNININSTPITVDVDDFYTDFVQIASKTNHTNYPVVNKKNECLGLIKLTETHKFEKQKVILVDHNAFAQSVEGIDEAEILEIIDHHNLGAIGTSLPINFRSKPVGCTSTMLYGLFLEKNVEIPKSIGGIMLSAILSDTLLFTSPTTTVEDKEVALKLAEIVGVDVDTYGYEMLKAASSIKDLTVEEIITGDIKVFPYDNKSFTIGQVMTMDFDHIKNNMSEFVEYLNNMTQNHILAVLFVTDVIKQGSYILYDEKSSDIIKEAYGLEEVYQGVFVEGIVSRKKQMVPNIMDALS